MQYIFIKFPDPKVYGDDAKSGFTIVELIVVMLVLGILTGLLFGPLDDLYSSNSRNLKSVVQFGDTRSALRSIQQQAALSSGFLALNSDVTDPDPTAGTAHTGSWDSTGSDANHRVLITRNHATTTTAGKTTLLNTGSTCDTPIFNDYIYFVENNTLYRRTLTSNNSTPAVVPCSGTWDQKQTCKAGFSNSRCQAIDAKIASNVSKFSTGYLNDSYSDSGTATSSPGSAKSVIITLETTVGKDTVKSTIRITRTNDS